MKACMLEDVTIRDMGAYLHCCQIVSLVILNRITVSFTINAHQLTNLKKTLECYNVHLVANGRYVQ